MEEARYSRPQVRDYGNLLELTAAVDVNLVGAMGNVVMAAMSNPIGSPRGSDPSLQSGGVGGVVSGGSGGGGAGGAGVGGGGGGNLIGSGGGGKLPFSGFPVVLLAAIGAMVASAGAVLRSLLRRDERSDA